MEDIGQIYKLRVWHDNSDTFAGWHLDKIMLEPVGRKNKDQSFLFKCSRWLDEFVLLIC